ncbi:MAG: FHA domain-containing protein [Aggregatilineales bacterium]
MNEYTFTVEKLADLLREAEQAHAAYEKALGAPDTAWHAWYADFIIKKLQSKPEKIAEPLAETNAVPAPPSASRPGGPGEKLVVARNRIRVDTDPSALRVCPTCGHRNRPGTLLCENCGTNLTTGQQAAVGTRDLREAEAADKPAADRPSSGKLLTDQLDGDKPAADKQSENAPASPAASRLDSAEAQAICTAGTGVFEEHMMLRIEIEGGATPILLKPKALDIILGRRDPTTGATPDVDLTPYAGYRMGVSRKHASLKLAENQLNLWDLGSSNGTFLNGTRLSPHRPYPVRDGDEIRLGQMILRLFFQSGQSSASKARPQP